MSYNDISFPRRVVSHWPRKVGDAPSLGIFNLVQLKVSLPLAGVGPEDFKVPSTPEECQGAPQTEEGKGGGKSENNDA